MSRSYGKSALLLLARKRSEQVMGSSVAKSRCRIALIVGLMLATGIASAQVVKPKLDLGVTFLGDRTNPVNGSNSWLTGGGIEYGVDAFRGFGLAVAITGLQTSSIGNPGVPLAFVTTTFGPRYRYTRALGSGRGSLSVFGEALLGEANAFHSSLPSTQGVTDSANSLALQVGGGIDVGLSRRVAFRALQAEWLRTQLQNGTTNVQNHLQLGSGLVLRF
jgi:hypothetical protein